MKVFLTSASPAIRKLGTVNFPLRSVLVNGAEKDDDSRSSEAFGAMERARRTIRSKRGGLERAMRMERGKV